MTVVINGTTGIDTVQDGIITNAKIASMAATKLTGQVPDANAPSGSVIQVVNATASSPTTTTGTTFIDTGLTASITPTSTSSKILIIVNQNGLNNTASTKAVSIRLLKDSTQLSEFAVAYGYGLSQFVACASFSYLDSPSTTSSLSYKTQFKGYASGGTAYVQDNSSVSSITLLEISA